MYTIVKIIIYISSANSIYLSILESINKEVSNQKIFKNTIKYMQYSLSSSIVNTTIFILICSSGCWNKFSSFILCSLLKLLCK